MILYAESSAVLAWLLGEPAQAAVYRHLLGASHIVTSSLTLVECARGMGRGHASGRLSRDDERIGLDLLERVERTWNVVDLSASVVLRARGTFPVEPVRSLDALHLATALMILESGRPLIFLSLDHRMRANGPALGMQVLPVIA